MTPVLNPFDVARAEMGAWLNYSQKANAAVEPTLAHLVKIRASILNGCANCINMHSREARKHGETEQRLYLLAAWREAPVFSDRERAALAWTDALTLLAEKGAPDETAHAQLAEHFTEEEQVKLTLLINAINSWNRLTVGFHMFASDAELDALAA